MNAWEKNNAIRASTGTITDPRDAELQIPLASRAVFWRPRHAIDSPALPQLPYLYWLLETIRPRTVVQVGLTDGLLYMSICDGIERLGTRTLCLGIREGDDPLPPSMQKEHDRLYRSFSMITEPSESGASLLSDSELDLLLINIPVTDDSARLLADMWGPRLSQRAVVVFFQTSNEGDSTALARLLQSEPKRRIVGRSMSSKCGLDVLLHGAQQPDRLLRLVGDGDRIGAQLAARQVFGRLGDTLKAEQTICTVKADLGAAELAVHRLNETLAQREREAAALASQLSDERSNGEKADADTEALRMRIAQLMRRSAEIETENVTLRASLDDQAATVAALQTQSNTLRDTLARKDTELAGLRDAVARAEAAQVAAVNEQGLAPGVIDRDIPELAESKADSTARDSRSDIRTRLQALQKAYDDLLERYNARMDDLSELVRKAEAEKRTDRQEIAALRERLQDNHNAETEALRQDHAARIAELEANHAREMQAVFATLSWRMTKPLRWVRRTITR